MAKTSNVPNDLSGKSAIVTGSNTGIGRVTAEVLAARGAKVFLACRSEEKTLPVLERIRSAGGRATFMQLDLGNFESIRKAVKQFLATDERLDILINNAGLAGQPGLTQSGFEMTFGTNHLGPFLFTNLLMPRLRESAPARIVNVASSLHAGARKIDFDAVRRPASGKGTREYFVSKLCNVLFTKELARGRAGAGVHSYALHPGAIATNVWSGVPWPMRSIIGLFLKSVETGAQTSIWCATSPEIAAHDGCYYVDCREKRPSKTAENETLARELWDRSADWCGLKS